MTPDDWQSVNAGQGSCFHQALHRWALLHQQGEHGFKVAVGVVGVSAFCLERHYHAWLERGPVVISAVSGASSERVAFYREVGVDPATVHLVNPRSVLRRSKWRIDRDTVHQLLEASGVKWREERGGVLPV